MALYDTVGYPNGMEWRYLLKQATAKLEHYKRMPCISMQLHRMERW